MKKYEILGSIGNMITGVMFVAMLLTLTADLDVSGEGAWKHLVAVILVEFAISTFGFILIRWDQVEAVSISSILVVCAFLHKCRLRTELTCYCRELLNYCKSYRRMMVYCMDQYELYIDSLYESENVGANNE